jgi:phosphatidylserine/phosphatidylglycerophosphate/cardiolipin synthase-like enzyme
MAATVALCSTLLLAGCGSGQSTVSTPTPAVPATTSLGEGLASATVFAEPDDKRGQLTGALRAASKSVDLTMYILTDRTLIHDLEYAHGNGVHVRVILEQYPIGSSNQRAYDQLTAADIPVHWAPSRFALTHEKTMIVDGRTAYILTLNFSASAFSRNREFGVVDTNPVDVQAADAIFNADWNDKPYAPTDPNLVLSPSNSRADLVSLINRAKHTVDVYAEEVQDEAVEAALAAAQRRGAQVRLISNAGDASNAQGLAVLQQAGVSVRLLTSPYIHAKLIVVDGSLAFVGSENISTASLDRNRELGVILSDRSAIKRLAATFERDWTR